MDFPVVTYGCDSWTLKKAEHQRIDAFELWCWRRLLRVPWTAWRTNQSMLKQISLDCSLEGLMLKPKPQYRGYLMQRTDSFEKCFLNVFIRDWKSVLNIHWRDWCWSWNSNILATWCKELTHWKRPWCWERLKAGGEGDNRGWDGWMASLTQWTWVWVNSGSWWWTGRPGMLQSMGLQRVGHDWATELN